MTYSLARRLRIKCYWPLVGMALIACAGAPVQEMSDARQAIKAAQEAGAEQFARDTFSEAQTLLSTAEAQLQKRQFRTARRDASAARAKAVQALHTAQTKRELPSF